MLDELKAKVLEFKKPGASEKQQVLGMLKGVITKKDLAVMSLQGVVELLVMVMELPEVEALNKSGESITLAELTRKERKPRGKKPEEEAEPTEDDADDDILDDDED